MRRSAVFGSFAASASIASSSGRTSTPAASGIAGMSEAPERPGALADASASLVFAAFARSKGEASVKSPSAESALEKASTLSRAARRSSSVKRPFASFFSNRRRMVARSDSADRSFSRKRASRSAGIASSRRPGSSASRSVSKGFEASFGIPAARRSAKAAPRRSAAALPPQASRRSAAREKNDIRLALCVGADGPSAGTAHAGAVCDYSRRIADGAVTEKGERHVQLNWRRNPAMKLVTLPCG